jgi:DNA helicase-2/ATP-dependent DNA helicase PcrA
VPKPTLSDYLARTSLVCADEDLDGSGDEQVTLCTLHGAKGLEFRLVILVGVEEGFLPHERTMNPHQTDLISGDIDEERRLLYVGLTRAMDRLVLTRCLERLVRGRPQPRTPSRFLDDVPEDLLGTDDLCAEPSPEQVQSMVAELLAQFGE